MVETAPVLPFMLLLLLGFVQLTVIGAAALAVRDAAASCGRCAALNGGANQGGVSSYVHAVASALIDDSHLQPITVVPAGAPRAVGSPVSVKVSYDLSRKFGPAKPFSRQPELSHNDLSNGNHDQPMSKARAA
ncbi:MAG: hypothetical protein WA005_09785 [Candidatus Binataceae bacterium]